MQSIDYESPRVKNILSRLQKRLGHANGKPDGVARLININPATLEYMLRREQAADQAMAWDDPDEVMDKLEEWLLFEYDERAEGILTCIEIRLATGLTRDRLANEAGIRLESLEYLLKRMAGGSTDRADRDHPAKAITALEAWLAEEDGQGNEQTAEPAPTHVFMVVQRYLGAAHSGRRLIAITGDVGIGKTWAAKAYAAAHPKTDRNPGVVYVEFTELDAKPLAAMQRILKAMPGRSIEAPKQEHMLFDYLAANLKQGDLLILDECNHLSGRKGTEGRALAFIRDLHERSRAGIAMLGNPELRARVWGDDQQDFAALASRTMHYDLGHTKEPDVDAWMQWSGLTGRTLRKTLIDIATRPGQKGGLRSLARIVDDYREFYQGHPVEVARLKQIAQMAGRL